MHACRARPIWCTATGDQRRLRDQQRRSRVVDIVSNFRRINEASNAGFVQRTTTAEMDASDGKLQAYGNGKRSQALVPSLTVRSFVCVCVYRETGLGRALTTRKRTSLSSVQR